MAASAISVLLLLALGPHRTVFAETGEVVVASGRGEAALVPESTFAVHDEWAPTHDVTYTTGCGTCDASCDCHRGWLDNLDYTLIGRGGGSYYDVPGESLWSGSYGGDLIVGLTESWAAVGSANANHVTGGTQFAATVGFMRANNLAMCDPWSMSVAWDQFTESRVDGLYLTQLRLQAGYAFNACTEVGAVYTNPTNRDNDVPYTYTFLGTDFTEFGTVNMSESVSGYVAREFANGLQASLVVGYREDPDTMLFSGSVTAPLNDRLAVYAGGSYGERFGTWGTGFGMEWRFGRDDQRSGSSLVSTNRRFRSTADEHISLVSYVPPAREFTDPPEGTVLPYDELNPSRQDLQTVEPNVERLSRRLAASLHKRVSDTFGKPARLWGGTSGDPDQNPFFRNLSAVNTFNVRYGQPGKTTALFVGEAQ
ncbi:MAG: hypothetical protein QGG36_21665 [Pirellulaceae bacterium]|jgi:hypothetical protein|nr:hypothetical protein [Pirellulaceae bacterium]MDP7018428.1 hypothetical protein [Pirellulaceae bacterium]